MAFNKSITDATAYFRNRQTQFPFVSRMQEGTITGLMIEQAGFKPKDMIQAAFKHEKCRKYGFKNRADRDRFREIFAEHRIEGLP